MRERVTAAADQLRQGFWPQQAQQSGPRQGLGGAPAARLAPVEGDPALFAWLWAASKQPGRMEPSKAPAPKNSTTPVPLSVGVVAPMTTGVVLWLHALLSRHRLKGSGVGASLA